MIDSKSISLIGLKGDRIRLMSTSWRCRWKRISFVPLCLFFCFCTKPSNSFRSTYFSNFKSYKSKPMISFTRHIRNNKNIFFSLCDKSKFSKTFHSRIFSSKVFFSTNDNNEGDQEMSSNKTKPSKINWEGDFEKDAVVKSFDELSRKEGFSKRDSLYADEESFETKNTPSFLYQKNLKDSHENDNEDDLDMLVEERLKRVEADKPVHVAEIEEKSTSEEGNINDLKESEITMEERIAIAQRDTGAGTVSVPQELENVLANESLRKKLGFKTEVTPFGDDETPRNIFKLHKNPLSCPACGVRFQDQHENKPGFLPSDKYEIQQKLNELQHRKERLMEWTADDEVDWLIDDRNDENSSLDKPFDVEEMTKDLEKVSKKRVICKRCHGLQNHGQVDESLRVGFSDDSLLSQENFVNLLSPIRSKSAVVIAIVDLFDFSGSILPELDSIVGDNPVFIAANKADLLPTQLSQLRIETWVRDELKYLDINCVLNKGGAVRLVSCKTGYGVVSLLDKAREMAEERDCDIYVIGAANAGKSSFLNFFLDRKKKKKRAGDTNAKKGTITTSPLPGTTLEFIKVGLPKGRSMYDTPGLLVPGTLTHMLTPEELKLVVPKKKLDVVTLRVPPGKCVLVGGLARIEVNEDSKPFLFSFFLSNDIKLHVTKSSKATEVLFKHVGKLITPPLLSSFTSIEDRLNQLGEFEPHNLEIDGNGWTEAAADITLSGLGWVAVTGPGIAKVTVFVPKKIKVSVRPPLMPFDIWESTAKFTGGKIFRKGGKTKSGKNRKGVGRK